MSPSEDSTHDSKRELDTEPPVMLPPDLQSLSPESGDNEDGSKASLPEAGQSAKGDKYGTEDSLTNFIDRISIPGFTIEKELGRGGMGAVFLATEESLQRKVALKIVSQSLVGSTGLRERFDSEVKTLASLHHSNIAQLYTAGLTNDEPFFAMEYVDGPTLDRYVPETLKDREAAELLTSLCDAVSYCHEKGVIHRDLKPSNILLTSKGQPKIADFGLAKALNKDDTSTKTGEILGTPGYMSPEQAGGVVKNMGPGCDVYGLGAILYRLITGRAPFVSQEPFQTVIQVLSEDPIAPHNLNPSVSRDLETICLKCLEKNVSKRYASPEELKEDLNRFLEGRPIHARPASWVQVSGKWMRRNPASTVSILALLVVIVGAVVGLVMHNSVLSQELARSRRLANSGSRFAKWITEDHLGALNQVSGTTVPRTQLIQRVSDYLQESYDDMPSDPVYTERLGFTYSQLAATQGAGAQNTTANLDGARKNLERAIELYDLTLEENSKDAKTFERVTQLKVDALVSLCDLEGRLGNEQAQKQFLEDAKTLLPEIKEKSPQASFIRIQILGRETESLLAQGEFRKALNSLEPLAAAVTGLESFDDDENAQVEASNQRIVICGYRSTCLKNLDDYPGAEKSLREMVRLSENAADPENVLHEKRLSSTLVNLGDIIFEQEKANESLEIYERACKIARVLADEDPSSVDAQLSLGVKLSRLARNHQFLGNFQLADTAIKEAIDRLKLLVSQGKKDISIEKGFIIYQQTYATLGFLQGDLEKSQQRFAEHHKSCLEFKQRFEDKGFAINQLAESELTQALMLFDVWFKGDPIDPTKVREAAEYKQIKAHLKQSLQYYNEFESIKPLDVTQRNQVQSIVAVEKMLEDTVKEIESQADQ